MAEPQKPPPQPASSLSDAPNPSQITSISVSSQPTSDGDSVSSPNQADMPSSGSRRPNTPRREADLSSILTTSEKNELVQLISRITDTMQHNVIQVFDSTASSEPQPQAPGFWSKLPTSLKDLSLHRPGKENVKPNTAEDGQKNGTDPHAAKILADEGQEVLGPRLQELKKEVLVFFRRWQSSVNRRVSDISVKNAGSAKNSHGSTSKQGQAAVQSTTTYDTSTSTVEADAALIRLYPPTSTSLYSLTMEKKILLLHCLLLLLLSLEQYGAYSRVLLLNIASSLHVPLRILAEDEVRVAKSLSNVTKDISSDELTQKRTEENKTARRWKVGLASVAGAAVVGITGGLAAPLVAAGIGTILGGIGLGSTAAAGLLGAMAESTVVVGTLFGMYGARAGGKMMDQYAKDIQDFALLPLHGSVREEYHDGKDIAPDDHRLRVVLGISGWLTQKEDIVNPWRALGQQSEVYALRWELEALMKMGNSLETVVKSAAWSVAKKEIIARTSRLVPEIPYLEAKLTLGFLLVFASLFEALWPIGLLKISKIIDNPWSVGMVRADKAGVVLADAIINRVQGERGITLIGYSLGARMIYTCLMCLAEKRAFGLVENVVMMGTPAPSEARVWCALKSVVAGRLVNVYSANDYILGFLYRTSSIQYGVAGLQCITGISGIENVDVTDKVSGHLRYQYLVGSILKHIGWEDIDLKQVARDEETLLLLEEKKREKEKRRDAVELDAEAAELEKEVKEKNSDKNLRTQMRTPAKN